VRAAGKTSAVLNAKNLSAAFGARLQLLKTGRRYALKIGSKARGIM